MQDKNENPTCGIVIDYILKQIANKTYDLGDRLPTERELSAKLEVSRTTVREAIKVMNYMGFIESTQGSGNYVTDKYNRTITNIMWIIYMRGDMSFKDFTIFRQMLELQAFELAIVHSTEEQRAEMKQIVDLMDVTTEFSLISNLDKRLHKLLAEASHNMLIIINFNALSEVTAQYMSDTFWNTVNKRSDGYKQLQVYHHEIVDALIEHDVERGRKAIIGHFAMLM